MERPWLQCYFKYRAPGTSFIQLLAVLVTFGFSWWHFSSGLLTLPLVGYQHLLLFLLSLCHTLGSGQRHLCPPPHPAFEALPTTSTVYRWSLGQYLQCPSTQDVWPQVLLSITPQVCLPPPAMYTPQGVFPSELPELAVHLCSPLSLILEHHGQPQSPSHRWVSSGARDGFHDRKSWLMSTVLTI